MPRRPRNPSHTITRDGAMSASKPPVASVSASNGTKTIKRARPEQEFKYDRMFAMNADYKGLIELGRAMTQGSPPEDNPDLPTGYVYLSQFIAHDMSFAQLSEPSEKRVEINRLYGESSPSLDLDSLYGRGLSSDEQFYEEDKVRLRLGNTTATSVGNANDVFTNDLPRAGKDAPNPRRAIIADMRNDDNLVVAQTHVAFTKFHNAVVDKLKADEELSENDLFKKAREEVVKHYQWIVLNDFLPRVIDKAVLDAALQGLKFFKADDKVLRMPVEFSFAAFRFGHSQIASTYEWNRIFQSPQRGDRGPATLNHLFEFTGLNGKMGITKPDTLPSNWVIDWTRFYDIPGNGRAINRAKKIGTRLVKELGDMPPPPPEFNHAYSSKKGHPPGRSSEALQQTRSLAVFDLVRGANIGLPTGQDAADEINASWKLSPADIGQGPHAGILRDHGFDRRTPLWYYILREAELFDGRRLGPVGSRIVAETFVGIIRASKTSILRGEAWHPTLGREEGEFSMADLLLFIEQQNKPTQMPSSQDSTPTRELSTAEILQRVLPRSKSELNPLGRDEY